MKVYLIHYGELSLKGRNRKSYENALVNNINNRIKEFTSAKVSRRYGKMIIKTDEPKVADILKKVPGIAYFTTAFVADLQIEDICEKAGLLVDESFYTFKVETKRSNKKFPMQSPQISALVGAHILTNFDKKVLIRGYDARINVEIGEQEALVFCGKTPGIGGLPFGSSGKLVGMLSGGIDSPVAMQMLMKRGCEVVLMHAFNVRVSPEKVREKIYELSAKLAQFQGVIKLYMVPYSDMLSEIVKNVPDSYRMLVFKRSVIRMANLIAEKEKAQGIVNGDCVGQVASQTLENIGLMHNVSKLPILSPLLGFDKLQIIEIATQLGTYDISNLPYEDCCSLISGANPMTKGREYFLHAHESKFNFLEIEQQMLEDSIVKYFKA
ncbi:MAG: tRNA uracil 4-sulfurtransferase ThiI [Candidatus Absconditabacteria bacterium]